MTQPNMSRLLKTSLRMVDGGSLFSPDARPMQQQGSMSAAGGLRQPGGTNPLMQRMESRLAAGTLSARAAPLLSEMYGQRDTNDTNRFGITTQARTAANANDTNRFGITTQAKTAAAADKTNQLGITTQAKTSRYGVDAQSATSAMDNLTKRYGIDTGAATDRYKTDATNDKERFYGKEMPYIGSGMSSPVFNPIWAQQKAEQEAVGYGASKYGQVGMGSSGGLGGNFNYNFGMKDGGDLRTGMGGHVPGEGKGDKIAAKYEPGEFVVSNAMLASAPGLRERLHDLRGNVLAAQGKTVAEADAGAMNGPTLRAEDGFMSNTRGHLKDSMSGEDGWWTSIKNRDPAGAVLGLTSAIAGTPASISKDISEGAEALYESEDVRRNVGNALNAVGGLGVMASVPLRGAQGVTALKGAAAARPGMNAAPVLPNGMARLGNSVDEVVSGGADFVAGMGSNAGVAARGGANLPTVINAADDGVNAVNAVRSTNVALQEGAMANRNAAMVRAASGANASLPRLPDGAGGGANVAPEASMRAPTGRSTMDAGTDPRRLDMNPERATLGASRDFTNELNARPGGRLPDLAPDLRQGVIHKTVDAQGRVTYSGRNVGANSEGQTQIVDGKGQTLRSRGSVEVAAPGSFNATADGKGYAYTPVSATGKGRDAQHQEWATKSAGIDARAKERYDAEVAEAQAARNYEANKGPSAFELENERRSATIAATSSGSRPEDAALRESGKVRLAALDKAAETRTTERGLAQRQDSVNQTSLRNNEVQAESKSNSERLAALQQQTKDEAARKKDERTFAETSANNNFNNAIKGTEALHTKVLQSLPPVKGEPDKAGAAAYMTGAHAAVAARVVQLRKAGKTAEASQLEAQGPAALPASTHQDLLNGMELMKRFNEKSGQWFGGADGKVSNNPLDYVVVGKDPKDPKKVRLAGGMTMDMDDVTGTETANRSGLPFWGGGQQTNQYLPK